MKRFFILWLIWVPALALAQSSNITTLFTGTFKKAEILYSQYAYRNALQLYLYVAEKNPSNLAARQRIGDCYFRLGNMEEAEKWYAELANLPDADPKAQYQYAQILSIRENYTEAEKWYKAYGILVPDDKRTASKLEFLNKINYFLGDSILYHVSHEPYNSDQSDFAPQYYDDGIVFSSARNRDLFIKHQSFSALNDDEAMLNVFHVPFNAKSDGEATLFYKHDLNSPYHDGPVCFYNDRKQMAFSRSNLKAGKPVSHSGRVNLELYFAATNDRSKIGKLEEFPYNSESYSIGHPWMSNDGNTLLFASDMPGGQGGTDIYQCVKKDGKWEVPQNLGASINTRGDELYPFLANDSTLYFASDGYGGFGGLDNYAAYRRNSGYTIPRNLGFPINTAHDDFSMTLDKSGRNGLFASNRTGGLGYDDIYSFTVKSFLLVGKVVQRDDHTKRIADAHIDLKDDKGVVIQSRTSDTRGIVSFDLDFDKKYSFAAAKEGYSWIDSLDYSTLGKIIGQDTVIVPLWEHALFAKGIIYSNESQSKLAGVTVTLTNFTDETIDSLVTDASGAYHFLVEPNKKYLIKARKIGFLPQEVHMNTKGLYKENLLNDMVLEEEFMDKVVIQFDFDKSFIRDSEKQKLEKLHKDLNRRKKSTLHISAFADSFGTNEYNQALSDRRASSVLEFFKSLGIDVRRIEARGFGETLLLNRCSDGVDCSEEEHSLNRRAELKVQIHQ